MNVGEASVEVFFGHA